MSWCCLGQWTPLSGSQHQFRASSHGHASLDVRLGAFCLWFADRSDVVGRDDIASRKLEMPTLVLWADSDGALGPQLLNGLQGYVPDISIHTLKNCSHWIQQDR